LKLKLLSITTVIALLTSGCSVGSQSLVPDNSNTRTQNGALIGGLLGAVVGASQSHNKLKGALIGGAAGAAVGAGTGYLLDQQANEIANALGTGVNNDPLAALDPSKSIIVSKGNNYVKIMFRDSMMFAVNSDQLQPNARNQVLKIAQLLKRYPQTSAQIAGFTDSTGSYQYNLALSNRRAQSVARVIRSYGVSNPIYAKGCSYNKPLVPNKTPQQKALNRRVEIYLYNNPADAIDPCRQ
jgi:outer membrane protein OmpA-like peptidoglycan-associated protein